MKHVLLGIFAVLAYTTAMMYEPEQKSYSQADRDGMDRLVSALLVEKPKHRGKWTADEQRDALLGLWVAE